MRYSDLRANVLNAARKTTRGQEGTNKSATRVVSETVNENSELRAPLGALSRSPADCETRDPVARWLQMHGRIFKYWRREAPRRPQNGTQAERERHPNHQQASAVTIGRSALNSNPGQVELRLGSGSDRVAGGLRSGWSPIGKVGVGLRSESACGRAGVELGSACGRVRVGLRSGSSRAAVWLRAGLGLVGNGLASGCGQCVIWLRCADSNQGPAGLQRAALATAPCTLASNAAIDSFCGSPTDGLWMLGCAGTRERGALKALALPPSHHPVKTKNTSTALFRPPTALSFPKELAATLTWLRRSRWAAPALHFACQIAVLHECGALPRFSSIGDFHCSDFFQTRVMCKGT